MRTPVQPLLAIAELIEQSMDGKDSAEVSRAELDMLVRNAMRLERLSTALLEVSRIESNSLKLNKDRVNLNEEVQSVIKDAISFVPNNRRVKIVFESNADEPVMVEADRPRIFQVLSNILRNAIHFTEEGTIIVTLQKHDSQAVVRVRDMGKGIDPQIFPKIFTKFVTKSEEGTGLGLYLCKGIIDAHGGKIWGENHVDGKGATFTFVLPA